MNIELHNGDCLELMANIPSESIDMILCDLPYGTTACKWDNVIPFEPLWEQYNRIIKGNGAIVLFGSEPFSTLLRYSNLKMYKYDWVWVKSRTVGFLNAKNAPLKKHEYVHVFSKGMTANNNKNRMCYHPQGLIEVNKIKNLSNEVKIQRSAPDLPDKRIIFVLTRDIQILFYILTMKRNSVILPKSLLHCVNI